MPPQKQGDLGSPFPTTQWTALLNPIRERRPEAEAALEKLCRPGTEFYGTRNPWVVRTTLAQELVGALRDAMTSLPKFGWLEEIADKPEGFEPARDSDFEPVRKALDVVSRAFPPPVRSL